LIWGTYVGGSDYDGLDPPLHFADHKGDIIIGGDTYSEDLPTPGGAHTQFSGPADVYVAKISADGATLHWGTYLGGSETESLHLMALGLEGDIYLAGHTLSNDFPVVNAIDPIYHGGFNSGDLFLARLASDGSAFRWCTYFGRDMDEDPIGLLFDQAGNLIVACSTNSGGLPCPGGYDDSYSDSFAGDDFYVAKLASSGESLLWGTYLGGISPDELRAAVLDPQGNIILAGTTTSSNLPCPNGFDSTYSEGILYDLYLAKLSPDGSNLIWATYLGGENTEFFPELALDGSNNPVILCHSMSADMPTPNGYSHALGGDFGNYDLYAAKISADGSELLWGTYLGGGDSERPFGISVTADRGILVAALTASDDAPTTAGAFDTTFNGSSSTWSDLYFAKLSDPSVCNLDCSASVPACGGAGFPVVFEASAETSRCTGTVSYDWTFGDGEAMGGQAVSHVYGEAGLFEWSMAAEVDGVQCFQSGSIRITEGLQGDCDGSGSVSIGEVQRAVNMFLGSEPPGCYVDCSGDQAISIGEVQMAINAFLGY